MSSTSNLFNVAKTGDNIKFCSEKLSEAGSYSGSRVVKSIYLGIQFT